MYWILPFAVSALLFTSYLYTLINPGSAYYSYPFQLTFFPLVFSLVWYLMVIVFHYALKRNVSKYRYLNDQKKNYEEASFIEKTERRDFLTFKKKEKENRTNGAYTPVLDKKSDSILDDFS